MRAVTRLSRECQAKGFLIRFDSGYGITECSAAGSDDFQFFDDVMDWAAANLCLDTERVYSTGFSNGAFMSNSLGCVCVCMAPAGRRLPC